jgi:hypothetical protein
MAERFRQVTINIASVNVAGGPGLSLLALVVAIAYQFPEARWLLLSGIAGGALLGAAKILLRRRRSLVAQRHHWIDTAGD